MSHPGKLLPQPRTISTLSGGMIRSRKTSAPPHLNDWIADNSTASSSDVEVNKTQVVLIVTDDFQASMLSICDYLNNASSGIHYLFKKR